MMHDINPSPPADADRHEIWEMLARKDIDGFAAQDWSDFGSCFRHEGFCGLDAKGALDPAAWRLRFPTVDAYREAWLRCQKQPRTGVQP